MLEVVVSDVCGPMEVQTLGGFRYCMNVIDSHGRWRNVLLLRRKSDALAAFREWKARMERLTARTIGTVRTDNGGEYTSAEFEAVLASEGIIHETTAPESSAQNGISERAHGVSFARLRTMLSDSGLPLALWGEAAMCEAYVSKRLPSSSLDGLTPYEVVLGNKPDVAHLREFGCDAYVLLPKRERSKIGPQSFKGQMVGYCEHSKAYRVYDPSRHRVVKSRNVVFAESWRRRLVVTDGATVEPRVVLQDLPDGDDDCTVLRDSWPIAHDILDELDEQPTMNETAARTPDLIGRTAEPERSKKRQLDDTTTQHGGDDSPPVPGGAVRTDDEPERAQSPAHSTHPSPPLSPASVQATSPVAAPSPPAPLPSPARVVAGVRRTTRVKLPSKRVTENADPVSRKHQHYTGPALTSAEADELRRQLQRERDAAYLVDKEFAQIFLSETLPAESVAPATSPEFPKLVPRTFKHAMRSRHAGQWLDACKDEMSRMEEKHVWELVPRDTVPAGKHVVDSRWVLDLKYDAEGNPVRYKLRFVAKGFSQQPGVDFTDTTAPTARPASIRAILNHAARHDWELHQMDVKTAFRMVTSMKKFT